MERASTNDTGYVIMNELLCFKHYYTKMSNQVKFIALHLLKVF